MIWSNNVRVHNVRKYSSAVHLGLLGHTIGSSHGDDRFICREKLITETDNIPIEILLRGFTNKMAEKNTSR